MAFETERLILRHWEENDAENLYKYAKDPDIAYDSGWPPYESVEYSLEKIRGEYSNPEYYAICLKSDNIAIGTIILVKREGCPFNDTMKEMEIGYWIGKPFWGRGLVPEAVYRIQKHAFYDLGCTALWCGYYEGNNKSLRVMEKSGFHYDHTEKDIYVPPLDTYKTEILTYLTREEWDEHIKKSEK